MSLADGLAWSLLRCLVVAFAALWPAQILVSQIRAVSLNRYRRFWLLAALCPLFVPELLVGFHYRLTATQLSSGWSATAAGAATELLYAALQLGRTVATGVAVLLLLPPSTVTSEALHGWQLLRATMDPAVWRRGWWSLKLAGPWSALITTWSLLALVVFQEFETAALLQIDRCPVTWTVWLFDAHAARQPLRDSLRQMSAPLLCSCLLLAPAAILRFIQRRWNTAGSSPRQPADEPPPATDRLRASPWMALFCVLPGTLLIAVWPVAANLLPAFKGLVLPGQSTLLTQAGGQILTSAGFAAGSAVLSMIIATTLLERPTSPAVRFLRMMTLVVMVSAGLMGSLVLSLTLLAVFQTSPLRAAYDSWLPMLTGQSIAVFPRALAVVALLMQTSDASATHSARLLFAAGNANSRRRAAAVIWRLTTGRWILGGLVIAHWCFWDVTVASILRPIELEPVVTRLYNEMHYGRTEALLSLSLLSMLTPVGLTGLALIITRFLLPWMSHLLRR